MNLKNLNILDIIFYFYYQAPFIQIIISTSQFLFSLKVGNTEPYFCCCNFLHISIHTFLYNVLSIYKYT